MSGSLSSTVHEAPRRVLVVDDNEDAADLLCSHLTASGVEASAAYDAQSAWDTATKLRPDTVLLDIELPDEAGDVLARRLRSAGLARSIVAMTGHSGAAARDAVQRGGFDGYLRKPCPLRDVDALLGIGSV